MTSAELLQSFDARVWAREFIRIISLNPSHALDEEMMIGWFSNALMRGYDEYAGRQSQQLKDAEACIEGLIPFIEAAERWPQDVHADSSWGKLLARAKAWMALRAPQSDVLPLIGPVSLTDKESSG